MEKFYTNPEAEIVVLSGDDVITSSTNGTLEDIVKPPVDEGWGGFN